MMYFNDGLFTPMNPLPNLPLARQALLDWCAQHSVGPRQLAAALHCDYQHAWRILRSAYPLNPHLVGLLLIHYGVTGPAPAIAAALKPELDRRYEAEQQALELRK